MADRQEASSPVGELLKDMALRSGSAFPDFDAVLERERIGRRRGRLVLTVSASLALLCLAAGLSWSSFFPARPLIESWDGPSEEMRVAEGASSGQDPLVSYIEVLWNSSADSGSSTR
jgi:hypothetical protein